MAKMKRKFKGIWIPAEIWLSQKLTLQEKCLIAEIDSFDMFWMSNKGIAEFLGVSSERARKVLMQLKNKGVIDVQITRDPYTQKVVSRVITIRDDFRKNIASDDHSMVENDQTPLVRNDQTPLVENDRPLWSKTTSIEQSIENKVIDNKLIEIERGQAPKHRKTFQAPSLAEVQAYCQECGNGIDPERFIDFYASKGWMVGKNKMKDWRAAVRNWERRDREQPRQTRNLSRSERQRLEDAELERMCREYDSGNSKKNIDDFPRKLPV